MLGDVLQRAHSLLTGDRNEERGDPTPIYQCAAEIYSAWTGQFADAGNMIEMMIAVKMAREKLSKKHNADNAVDCAAYWDIYAHIQDRDGRI